MSPAWAWSLLPAVVLLAYASVFNNWWFHDDWVLLADAAGVTPRDDSWVRVVSYEWYWRAFYPLFGLAPAGWAATRLLLHLGSALLVGRLAARLGQPRSVGILAGLLFAASPVAYECLCWGTGAVELLAVFLGLLALDRWLAGGGANRTLALGLALLAIFSKEVAFVVPLLMGLDLARRRERRPLIWAGPVILVALSAVAFILVARDIEATTNYVIGVGSLPRNLFRYGSWLVAPAPTFSRFAGGATVSIAIGVLVWLAWGTLALERRRQTPLHLLCVLVALVTILPATTLGARIVPRYDYAATACLALSVATAVTGGSVVFPRRWLIVATALLGLYVWASVAYQDDARWSTGRPAHRLVFKAEVSRVAYDRLDAAGVRHDDVVALVQGPRTNDEQMRVLRETIGGEAGVRLMYGAEVEVRWLDDPEQVRRGELMVVVDGINLQVRGRTD